MPIIAVNGTELFYEITGESGPPLVLVHGAIDDRHGWDMVIAGFAQAFQVITYDRRGHGQSQPQHELSTDGTRVDVEDLAALIETLHLGPAHIVGQSAGACIVLNLAMRYPALLRTISVNEPPLFALLDTDPAMGSSARHIQTQLRAMHDLIEAGNTDGATRAFFAALAGNSAVWDLLPPALQNRFMENIETFIVDSIDPDFSGIDLPMLSASAARHC